MVRINIKVLLSFYHSKKLVVWELKQQLSNAYFPNIWLLEHLFLTLPELSDRSNQKENILLLMKLSWTHKDLLLMKLSWTHKDLLLMKLSWTHKDVLRTLSDIQDYAFSKSNQLQNQLIIPSKSPISDIQVGSKFAPDTVSYIK